MSTGEPNLMRASTKTLLYSQRKFFGYSRKNKLNVSHKKFLDLISEHKSDGKIIFKVHGNVADIDLVNPTKRNAISGSMMIELANIIDSIEEINKDTPKLTGLILRSQSGFFSSGADLKLVKDVLNTPEKGLLMSDFMTDALNRIRSSQMISVSVLSGPALGGGAELSTATDFRIMKENDSNFIQFVHAKIGAFPGWGGLTRLTSITGRNWALRATGTSCRISPPEALRIKLVDDLIPSTCHEDPLTLGLQFLNPFTSQPYQGSVLAFKRWIANHDALSHSFHHPTSTSQSLHYQLLNNHNNNNIIINNNNNNELEHRSQLSTHVPPVDDLILERQLFGERWCGPDNLEALGGGGGKGGKE